MTSSAAVGRAIAGDIAFADQLIENGLVYDDEGNVIDGE